MTKRILFILMCFSIPGFAQDISCEKIVNYKMEVVLNPENKTITGTQILKWKNTLTKPVAGIYFHAYLNAFKNTQSSFLKQVFAGPGNPLYFGENWPDDGWGYLEVNSISASIANRFDNKDLSAGVQFIQPDDQNTNDQTVFKVVLPIAVNPSEEIIFHIRFTSKLPYWGYRTGFKGNYFFAGQWFPQIGVLENGAWNCHQYHNTGGFYADFGDYDVSITVPQDYIVGATGVLTDSSASDGKVTCRYLQTCVHDFAWTASPGFQTAAKTFQYSDLPPVKIRLFYFPDHEKYVDEYFSAIETALDHFGTWYLPYPYPQITIVDVPVDTDTGSMSYPGLIAVKVPRNAAAGSKELQRTIIYEFARQYWSGILAGNEFEHAWLDEGFASYSDIRLLNAVYGDLSYSKEYLSRRNFSVPFNFNNIRINPAVIGLKNYNEYTSRDKTDQVAWNFSNYSSYEANVRQKGSILLATLENYLGEDVFSKIMKTYAARFQFKHPLPQDFIDVVNEFSPQPMGWFFEQGLFTTAVLDYAVSQITSGPVNPPRGLDENGNLDPGTGPEKVKTYFSDIVVERLGEFIIPVDVLITFENGETVKQVWNGQEKWKKFSYRGDAAVLKVEIDPERKLLLDVNYGNNSKYRKRNSFPAFRWSAKWMFWLQHLLEVTMVFS